MHKDRRLLTPALLLGVLVAIVLLHLPVLNQPFGRDQGIFAYIGDGILREFVPFRDSWDHKPPGIDFAYALAFAVFGRQMVSVHLLELASILLTTVILFSLGRRLLGTACGLLAGALYGAGSALMFEWWDRGQAEFFMTLPLALSMYCAARAGILDSGATRWRQQRTFRVGAGFKPAPAARLHALPENGPDVRDWPPLAGLRSYLAWLGLSAFCAGLALYFKPTAGVMLAFLALLVIGASFASRAVTRGAAGLLTLFLGALAALLLLLAYFALNGALGDLYEAVILFNSYHVQTGANLTLAQMIAATFDYGARMGFLAPLGVLGAIALARRRQTGGISIVLWFAFLAAGIWVQGKFFSYHWSTLLAPLALMAAAGLQWLWEELRSWAVGRPLPKPDAVQLRTEVVCQCAQPAHASSPEDVPRRLRLMNLNEILGCRSPGSEASAGAAPFPAEASDPGDTALPEQVTEVHKPKSRPVGCQHSSYLNRVDPDALPLGEGMQRAKVGILSRLALMTLPLLAFGYGVVLVADQTPKLGRDLPFFLGQSTKQSYLANFGHNLRGVDVYSFSAAQETASYIAERTQPQDTVLVWGFQALVNYLADRRSPTRYVFNYPLTIDQPDSDFRAKARRTFLEDVKRSKPKYIVLVTNDVNPLQTVDSVTLLGGFPEFKSLIAAEYALEKEIADFHIYRQTGSP